MAGTSPGIGQHPLMGASLGTLVRALKYYGPVPRRHWPHVGAFFASAVARWPFRQMDRLLLPQRPEKKQPLEAPVFIVSYWRSGSTHLHNLLGLSPQMGIITPLASGLPNELLTLATWLRPLLEKGLPADRGVDRVAVTPRSPQEDEIPLANMLPFSLFHALYFGSHFEREFQRTVLWEGASAAQKAAWEKQLRYFYRKVTRHQGRQPLLIKNPVYTARVAALRQIWPEARFIYIYRNPYTVFHSSVQYYHKMLQSLSLQDYDEAAIERVVLHSYPRMLDALHRDTEHLPPEQFATVRYEDLEAQPLEVLHHLYEQLHLPGAQPGLKAATQYLKNLTGYQKNSHQYSSALRQKVDAHWGKYVERYGYAFPGKG